MTKTIVSVVGARPNFLKTAPLLREFARHPESIKSLLVHTGQHYDYSMSEAFFQDLELPPPDFHLEAGSASHSVQTAKVMTRFEEVALEVRPDWVVVFGDVNSTLACALVCAKERIPLAHVEAGLRSFDKTMPEEINRLLTDQVADLLFVSEPAGVDNLFREGVEKEKVFLVGNIMIDALIQFMERADSSSVLKKLGLNPGTYLVMTMHRAGNVDSQENLMQLVRLVHSISERAPIVFPLHPRTARNLKQFGLMDELQSCSNVKLTAPLGYLDFLFTVKHSLGILSDSGGVQSETTYLNVPCLTFREVTEQPVTVDMGTNTLVGLNSDQILLLVDDILNQKGKKARSIPLWDGQTAERITEVLLNH